MIIDVHSHDFPDFLAARAIAGMCKVTEGVLWAVGDGTLSNHIDHLELAGIDLAVSCPIATKPTQHEAILKRALALRDGIPDPRSASRIVPFASFHPRDPDVVRHLEEIAAAGIKGVKVHPYYQGYSLTDPSVWPSFEVVASLGLIVQCHAGYDVGYPGRYDACGPGPISLLLKNVPGLKFIAAHLGGCAGFPPHATDPLIDLGCYIDTSAIHRDWCKDEEMRILASWPADRIMFGTDFPWVHYPEAVRWVKSVRAERDWDALFSGNALRLLGKR